MRSKAELVSLVSRTEHAQTKKVEKRKTKMKKNGHAQKTVRGIRGVSPEEEKEGYVGKDLQKHEGFKPGMKQ